MHFVNAHRRTQCVAFAALFHPCAVRPFNFLRVPNNRGVLWRDFEEKSERVGIQFDVAESVADFEFVMRAFTDAGDKNFPNTGTVEQAQWMKSPTTLMRCALGAQTAKLVA